MKITILYHYLLFNYHFFLKDTIKISHLKENGCFFLHVQYHIMFIMW